MSCTTRQPSPSAPEAGGRSKGVSLHPVDAEGVAARQLLRSHGPLAFQVLAITGQAEQGGGIYIHRCGGYISIDEPKEHHREQLLGAHGPLSGPDSWRPGAGRVSGNIDRVMQCGRVQATREESALGGRSGTISRPAHTTRTSTGNRHCLSYKNSTAALAL